MMNVDKINGKKFNPSHIEHTIELGSVVERHIMGLNLHIYHQHVNAFQLIAGFDETEYYRVGDWHDSWFNPRISSMRYGIVRYHAADFIGTQMSHCHMLIHEDRGMMI